MTKCERCQREIEAGRPAFIAEGEVLCRDCHDDARPICPYCRIDLPRRPKARSKCPACREWIYVLKSQGRWPSSLLTLAQRDEAHWVGWLERCGLSGVEFDEARDAARRRGAVEPAPGEIVQQAFEIAVARGGEAVRMGAILEGFADFLMATDGDRTAAIEMRYRGRRLQRDEELRNWIASGVVSHVEVLPAPDCCGACEALAGRRWAIEEALTLGVLPCAACEMDEDRDDDPEGDRDRRTMRRGPPPLGNCRCCYLPVLAE